MVTPTPTGSFERDLGSTMAWLVGFAVLGGVVLFGANGYTLSLQPLALERTVLVSVAGEPTAATVRLDRTVVGTRLPVTVRFIRPGFHTVRIEANRYQPWEMAVRLDPGQALVTPSIRLWLDEPVELGVDASVAVDGPLVRAPLVVRGMELAEQTGGSVRLITRFSTPPLAATQTTDRSHVIVQLGNRVVATELDGGNTTPLVTLESSDPTPLVLSDSDRTLTLQDGSRIRRWTIR
jgi:hypothetical protein